MSPAFRSSIHIAGLWFLPLVLLSCAGIEPRPPGTPVPRASLKAESSVVPVEPLGRSGEGLSEQRVALAAEGRVWELAPPDGWSRLSSLGFFALAARRWNRVNEVANELSIDEAELGINGVTLSRGGEYYLFRLSAGFLEEGSPITNAPAWLWQGQVLGTRHWGGDGFFIYGATRTHVFGDPIYSPVIGAWHMFDKTLRGLVVFPYTVVLKGRLESDVEWSLFARADGGLVRLADRESELGLTRARLGGGLQFGLASVEAGLETARKTHLALDRRAVVDRYPEQGVFLRLAVCYRFDDGDGILSQDELKYQDLNAALPEL